MSHATLLDRFAHWVRTQPDAIYLTQPVASGEVVDYRWREVDDQVRRMAAHLRSLGLPPRSNIALLGKNSAHWLMADLAIWLAGHVSVPLYPTLNADTARYILEHSEAKLLFVGKMDEFWPIVAPGIPEGFAKIALPLAPALEAPRWDDLISKSARLENAEARRPEELATIVYTSGSTGHPKGVMISFEAMMAVARGLE
jgi:long-subunit acyl-CoA synthetase (AMP-forming)